MNICTTTNTTLTLLIASLHQQHQVTSPADFSRLDRAAHPPSVLRINSAPKIVIAVNLYQIKSLNMERFPYWYIIIIIIIVIIWWHAHYVSIAVSTIFHHKGQSFAVRYAECRPRCRWLKSSLIVHCYVWRGRPPVSRKVDRYFKCTKIVFN